MIQSMYLTVNEFAKLHHVNKRTLHYYDSVGVFSPQKTGENKYRYYSYSQSTEFEIILTLRELGMSIEEICQYRQNRDFEFFSSALLKKSIELEDKIRHLQHIRAILLEKREQLLLCQSDQTKKLTLSHANRSICF